MVKVLVIGARCRRQGIGEHVARWFAHAGATVCAVVGTSEATSAEAAETLRERHGIECRPYARLEEALEQEAPDVVAICSPFEHHRAHLEEVRRAGVHCLCEKPLWWDESAERVAETERIAEGFRRQGKLLATITQWPLTLPAFFALHPEVEHQPVRSVEMALAPSRPGPVMVLDAAPHLISLLVALTGHGEVTAPQAEWEGEERLTLEFAWKTAAEPTPVRVTFVLTTCPRPPRPASYTINGHHAQREIALPDYKMTFADAGRQVPIDDPLKLLVSGFLTQIEQQIETSTAQLVGGIRALELLWDATA